MIAPDLLAAQHALGRPGVVGVERHELDEAHLVRVLAGEPRERQHLVLGEAAHRDRVDLDRCACGKAASASRPASTCGSASRRVISKKRSRCSESIETLKRCRPAATSAAASRSSRKPLVVTERSSTPGTARASPPGAGSPGARAARRRSGARRGRPSRRAGRRPASISSNVRTVVALQPRQALGGHAVLAAEVAAVGDGDAHVADGAAVAVDEGLAAHATKSRTASSNTCVWRSTSASVLCGHMSAMLWNGVIITPRFSAWRCR